MPSSLLRRSLVRIESWPSRTVHPTPPQLARSHSEQCEAELSKVDEDPLTYFLTPAPAADDDDMDVDFDMVFDAGIEDAKHPSRVVRSISPSNLEGLTRRASPRLLTPPRTPSPRFLPDLDMSASSLEDEADDQEDYVRFTPSNRSVIGLPLSLRDFADSRGVRHSTSPRSPLSPAGSPATRGRALHNFASRPPIRPSLPRNVSGSRLLLHSWREPSPDVWSIQEETDEALDADKAGSSLPLHAEDGRTKPIDIPVAKPKKRVRFNLTPETI